MPLILTAVFVALEDSRIAAYIEELPGTHAVADTIDAARANLLHELSLTLAANRHATHAAFASARVLMRKTLTTHDGHCKESCKCGSELRPKGH